MYSWQKTKCFQQRQLNFWDINQEAIQIYPDKKATIPKQPSWHRTQPDDL